MRLVDVESGPGQSSGFERRQTGVLVDERDTKALAREIIKLARDPARRRALGSEARRRAEQSLTWVAAAERLVEIYERVIDRR